MAHQYWLLKKIHTVITLLKFSLGKLHSLTASIRKLKFKLVTDFSLRYITLGVVGGSFIYTQTTEFPLGSFST